MYIGIHQSQKVAAGLSVHTVGANNKSLEFLSGQ